MTIVEIFTSLVQIADIHIMNLIMTLQFSSRVFEVASTDLVNMGIMIISYTIKDITDEVGYLAVSGG